MTAVAAPVIEAEMEDWVAQGGGNSGIVGDQNHTYGFHCSANNVPSDDYSRWRDPNGSDGPYVNWNYCCAGDFRHGGNSKLRKMHADVLNGLMDGKYPMICEFIGQPWADKPVYYWARWNGIDTLQRYTGQGHDLWSHISWYRSRVDERAYLWVANMNLDEVQDIWRTDDAIDAKAYPWRTDSPAHTPPGTNKGYKAETGLGEAAQQARAAYETALKALDQSKANAAALKRIEDRLASGVPISTVTTLDQASIDKIADATADELHNDPERDGV